MKVVGAYLCTTLELHSTGCSLGASYLGSFLIRSRSLAIAPAESVFDAVESRLACQVRVSWGLEWMAG
jgi:hypothetical protein